MSERGEPMAAYRHGADETILRSSDGATIPPDDGNADYRDYLAWVEDGNEADPLDRTPQQRAAFAAGEDAERLRLVAERSRDDPAFAALADLALGVER